MLPREYACEVHMPRGSGAFLWSLGALSLVLLFAMLTGMWPASIVMVLLFAVPFVGSSLWTLASRRSVPSWRAASVSAEPGRLILQYDGHSKRILASEILASSAGVADDGTLEWALLLRGMRRPCLVRLRDRSALDALQGSIGVGQRDARLLTWRAGLATLGHVRTAIVTCLAAAAAAWLLHVGEAAVGVFFLPFLVASVLLSRFTAVPRAISLSSRGVHLQGARLPLAALRNQLGAFIAYEQIARVGRDGFGVYADLTQGFVAPEQPDGLQCRVRLMSTSDGADLTSVELDHIVLQIETAIARTRGNYMRTGELESELATLKKTTATREWLEYIASLERSQGAGYRAQNLSPDALVRAATDPDLDVAERFAAARLLRTNNEARVRIEEAASASRFPEEEKLLRVALEDEQDEGRIDGLLRAATLATTKSRV